MNYTNNFAKALAYQPHSEYGMTELLSQAYSLEKAYLNALLGYKFNP
jgi:hypothetical protein